MKIKNYQHTIFWFFLKDIGEFVAILFPAAGEALAKLSKTFPNIEQVKVNLAELPVGNFICIFSKMGDDKSGLGKFSNISKFQQ